MIMPTMQGSEAVVFNVPSRRTFAFGIPTPGGYLAYTLPEESVIELASRCTRTDRPVSGKGSLQSAREREPSGLAFLLRSRTRRHHNQAGNGSPGVDSIADR